LAFIQGNSPCVIEITDDVVRKSATSADYAPRLQKQITKQREFSATNKLFFCTTPAILSDKWNNDLYEASMQYIAGLDFIEFIKHASRDELELMCNHIDRVIDQSIAASPISTVPYSLLADKIRAIGQQCTSQVLQLFSKFPSDDLQIPCGVCHGDLTLSNILFCHTTIALIDFLDNFVETPLQDMAKVRQDTCYLWSCQLYRQPYDTIRTSLALKFMDARLDQLFKRRDFYVRHYPIFQYVNLARILPYCKTPQLLQHVERSMQTLVEHHV
jgi:hypothetical protein